MRPEQFILRKILSLGMLGIFLFAGMPHEFIHDEISGHKDTIDYYHSHDQVSSIHIHCKFLQEVLAPYLPGQFVNPLILAHCFSLFLTAKPAFYTSDSSFHNNLRGPPSHA